MTKTELRAEIKCYKNIVLAYEHFRTEADANNAKFAQKYLAQLKSELKTR